MKLKHILLRTLAFTLMLLVISSVGAQEKKTTEKEQYHIKVVENVNGKTKVIDTTFNLKEGFEKYQEQMKQFAKGSYGAKIDSMMQNMNIDSLMQLMEDMNMQISVNKGTEDKDVEITYGDSVIKNTMSIKIKNFDLSDDDKKKLLESENTDEILKMFDIDVDIDTTINGSQKQVKIVTIIKHIEIKDVPVSEIKGNKHPQIQQATKEEKLSLNSVNVYPNPSNGKVFLELETSIPGEVELLVTDMQGKEVFNDKFYNNIPTKVQRNLNIDGQKSGVYLLKITSQGKSIVKKLILEN